MEFSTSNSTISRPSTIMDHLSILRIVSLVIGLLFVRWIARGVYRVYFHPLSRFPGPRFSAFTRLPHLNAVRRGILHKHVARLHETYGEVVRISPDELSFIHPNAWRDIYGLGSKEDKGSAPPKAWGKYRNSPNGAYHLLNMPDPVQHARQRKIFLPAFSNRALTQQSPLFLRYANQLVSILKSGGVEGAQFDLIRVFNFTTFDIMGDLTFGESLHMLDNAEYDPWVKAIFQNFKRGAQLGLLYNYYPLVAGVFQAVMHKKVAQAQYAHLNFATSRVTKRLEKGRTSEGVDLWDLIFKQEEKGKAGLTRDEMDVNAGLFMIAGTETTATVLSGLMYLLCLHPASLAKLVKEVRSAFPSSDDITMESAVGLPYLNACIKEGMRMYPPVPIGLPHLTPPEGSTICGHYVPPGTTVAAPHWPMYYSDTIFRDPKSFVPERWTGDERYARDERAAFQPFSVGPRDCLGKNMAYHEMRLLLSKVIFHFDFELGPESDGDWFDQESYTLWQKKPLLIKVKTATGA
ncbi:cytochrome P450 [Ampelomyces quisqualis]|uniref:Cytochrome P450 n=1 Tax=Ampelomyces quisqualis TaxID=50730 RepID=A0A6A5QGY9_AMPQU|nr:cytochrome P450 [Ampelomyces quisqualis]